MNKQLPLAVAMLVSLSSVFAQAGEGWEDLSNEDGIKTWRREVPNSDLVALKGEGVIDAPIAKVANILIDTKRKLEWVAKIVEAKDIRTVNDYERIEYNHTSSGVFIVKDRDFVFHAKAVLDRTAGTVTMKLHSVEDALMPEQGPVRGELKESIYTLTSTDGGKQTNFLVEINADPKGSVPKWLVNLFQKSWPRKTIENVRKQAAKADVFEHPGIKAYFEAKVDAPAPAAKTKKK